MSTTILQALAAAVGASIAMQWWDQDQHQTWGLASITFATAFLFAAVLLPLDF